MAPCLRQRHPEPEPSLYINTQLGFTDTETEKLWGRAGCIQEVNTQLISDWVTLMSIMSSSAPIPRHLTGLQLVREEADEGLAQVPDGLCLGLVLVARAEESGVTDGIEGIGQGLGFAEGGQAGKKSGSTRQ